MDNEARQARAALQQIAEAETAARRHGQNNGVIPLVWGLTVFTALLGFDVLPRLAADPDLGLLLAGGLLSVLPVGAGAWTNTYRRRLPVQPRTVERPRLYFWWGLYHAAVVCGGMGIGFALAHVLGRRCFLPGTMTLIGLVDAAPLLYVGWQQRKAQGVAR